MLFQMEYLINPSPKNSNEIARSFLCKGLFIYLWEQNLDCQMCHYPNILLITIDFATNMYNYLFIYLFLLCMQFCNNDHMVVFIIMFCKISSIFIQFLWRLILQENKMSKVDFKDNTIYKYTSSTIIWSNFFCIISSSILYSFFCFILFK